ncbi:hypothetical protein MERGE_001326 [Pneumocystis wakefieldiae]|uniref:GATA-type domain-containing protein n=1 Tax=Pneumocystis wakefieldiae TaxID=38082 RepID=A0A899G6A7_9ASCO|nr:hypothetical protein MERGE_001326 [Pneumocystis wakefieldiae]
MDLARPAFFSRKNDTLGEKIASGFGLPVYSRPQVIPEENSHKYRTIEESGVLASCISQSRQALLQGLIFKKFSRRDCAERQGDEPERANSRQRVSKIGSFTLDIELFSFPETAFYVVKYAEKTDNSTSYDSIEDGEQHGNTDTLFSCKNRNTLNSADDDMNVVGSENMHDDSAFAPETNYLYFFEKYFSDIFENDALKVEKTSRAVERLKSVSSNPDFKHILHLIMTGKATIEQKTIFNLYMTSQLQKLPSNYNEKTIISSIFQKKCVENDNNNKKATKTKKKRKNPGEKWILPKDIIIEKLDAKEPFEVLLSFIYTEDSVHQQFQPITLKISSCSQKLWDFISKYSNDKEKVHETMSKILIGKRSEKLYFQYRITIIDAKTYKNESEERISAISRNKKSILPQKRKTIDDNDGISLSSTNNKYKSPIISKKTEKKHIIYKNWSCNICNTTETPLKRRGPDGPGTLCNACGMKWKGGKKILISKEYDKTNKTHLENKDQN